MPKIVQLPARTSKPSPSRKRRGRDAAAVLAAGVTEEPRPVFGLTNQIHMAYDDNYRHEARQLNPRARAIVGIEPYGPIY